MFVFTGISELDVPGTVIKTVAFPVHDGNQVFGVFGNQAEYLFLIGSTASWMRWIRSCW